MPAIVLGEEDAFPEAGEDDEEEDGQGGEDWREDEADDEQYGQGNEEAESNQKPQGGFEKRRWGRACTGRGIHGSEKRRKTRKAEHCHEEDLNDNKDGAEDGEIYKISDKTSDGKVNRGDGEPTHDGGFLLDSEKVLKRERISVPLGNAFDSCDRREGRKDSRCQFS